MKLTTTIVCLLCFFQICYGQCDDNYSGVFKHNLEDMDISHRSNMSLYSSDEESAGYVLNSSDFTQTPVIFQGGIWMGGMTAGGELRTSAKAYMDFEDYVPGILKDADGSVTELACSDWDQIFKVSKVDVNKVITDFEEDGTIDGVIPDDVLYYPGIGNVFFQEKYGFQLPVTNLGGLAPFFDRNSDGMYNAKDGDYPTIRGTESAFWASNDRHDDNDNYIGMEFLTTSNVNTDEVVLAFSSQIKIRVIYHGDEVLQDFYFGIWMDGDLGCITNDMVGCLPESNVVFYYGEEEENCQQGQPFSAGTAPVMLMKHEVNGGDKMSSFLSFNRVSIGGAQGGTQDPLTNTGLYNVLQGKWRDGLDLTYGNEGYNIGSTDKVAYQYNHEEDSEYGPWRACDSEMLVRDKRTLVNFGPYTLNPKDIIDIKFSAHMIANADLPCPTESDIMEICRELEEVITDTKDSEENEFITIYPNPFDGFIVVGSEAQNIGHVQLLDMAGKLVKIVKTEKQSATRIDTQDLESGIYLVQCFYKGEMVSVQKLLKY